jgi:hypothetical protein
VFSLKGIRQVGIVFLLLFFVLAIGCGQQLVCSPPNKIIANTCCIDSNSNNVCDSDEAAEETEEEPVVAEDEQDREETAEPETREEAEAQEEYKTFAETFVKTWNRKSYNALHQLFVKNYRLKFAPQEFNFLARKTDSKTGVQKIKIKEINEEGALYEIQLKDGVVSVSSQFVKEEDKYRHEPFYFFEELNVDDACAGDGQCFMDFAIISNNKNLCKSAAEKKADCVAYFGVSKSLSTKIDNCLQIVEYYSKTDCLTELAKAENTIEPCWQATYDKQIYECMGAVAAARENVDECTAFVASHGYPGTKLQKAYCILNYVRITSDTKACSEIDRRGDVVLGALQEGCYNMNFP